MYVSFILWFPIILSVFVTETFTNQAYRLVNEKAELSFYDKDLINEDLMFQVKKVNLTDISLTLRFTVTRDVVDRKIMVKIGVDKLSGSEYKHSGTSVVGNLCKAMERNIFGFKDAIKAHGYLDACELRKGTTYYLNDYLPNSSNYPKILPFGSYRIVFDVYHENTTAKTPIFFLYWYARVENILKF